MPQLGCEISMYRSGRATGAKPGYLECLDVVQTALQRVDSGGHGAQGLGEWMQRQLRWRAIDDVNVKQGHHPRNLSA
jgi:hypothetical protein